MFVPRYLCARGFPAATLAGGSPIMIECRAPRNGQERKESTSLVLSTAKDGIQVPRRDSRRGLRPAAGLEEIRYPYYAPIRTALPTCRSLVDWRWRFCGIRFVQQLSKQERQSAPGFRSHRGELNAHSVALNRVLDHCPGANLSARHLKIQPDYVAGGSRVVDLHEKATQPDRCDLRDNPLTRTLPSDVYSAPQAHARISTILGRVFHYGQSNTCLAG
jgi:hypothetical protein